MQALPKKNIDLQMLRGVAIILVVFYHLSLSATLMSYFSHKSNPFYLGVELFFILSGYVVTKSLERREYSAVSFVVKRIFRLYPALIAFLLISFVINYYYLYYPPQEHVRTLFSVKNTSFFNQAGQILMGTLSFPSTKTLSSDYSGGFSYMNGAIWTLSIEFQFYMIIFIKLLLFSFFRLSPLNKKIIFSKMAFYLFIIAICVRCSYFLWNPHYIFRYIINDRFDFLLAGVFIATRSNNSWIFSFKINEKKIVFHIFALFLSTLFFMSFFPSPLDSNPANAFKSNLRHSIGEMVVLISFSWITILAIRNKIGSNIPSFLVKAFSFIGDRSYSFYLLHFPIMAVSWGVMHFCTPWAFKSELSYSFYQLFITLLLLVPISEIMYRYIEIPFIKLYK